MLQKMFRHYSLLPVLLLAALLLAACPPAAAPAAEAPAAAAPAEAAPAAEAKATEAPAAEAPASDAVFTYWGGLIFSDAANQMLVDRITQWGEEKGIKTDVVMINQNETTQRVSAAIEAGTMPDALDMGTGLILQLLETNQLEILDELYAEIGEAHGGWMPSVAALTAIPAFNGHQYGIPFGIGGNVLYRRADVLEAAGFMEAPKTWEELSEMAKAQNPPETYGMGFALSNVGDANLTTTMLQSWGGRIADDEGINCTIDSQETRDFLTWITTAFADGLFPPGATTWDGAGDNVAYQSGNALFIANPGSVYLYMRDNDPDLGESTKYSALPGGPVMRIAPMGSPNARVIPTTSKHKELAMDLFKYLAEDEFMAEYYYNAIYGPVAESYKSAPIFTEGPVHVGLLDLVETGTPPAYPDVDNVAFAEYGSNFLTPRMVQRVVVDGISIDEAVTETQTACQAIYDKYK
jgi:ABC-type glycerol-3-phosphate transport system substrate-binding protein